MKNFIKNNIKIISTIIVTAVLCVSGTVYATTKYLSSDVTYKDTTVENALNDLYENKSLNINSNKIKNLLKDGLSYTFDSDYKYVFVYYGARYWLGANYSTKNMSEPIYTEMIEAPTFAVKVLIYNDVKKGSVVSLDGSTERLMNIFVIEE